MELMERMFADEADAVSWCRVMTAAKHESTGVWMVAKAKPGRTWSVACEQGISSNTGARQEVAQAVGLESVGITADLLALPIHGSEVPLAAAGMEMVGAA